MKCTHKVKNFVYDIANDVMRGTCECGANTEVVAQRAVTIAAINRIPAGAYDITTGKRVAK